MQLRNFLKTSLSLALVSSASLFSTNSFACSSQPYLGGMCAFGGNFAIRGWAKAEGQLLPIASNSALFSILGTIYGGDGRTTFALPDLRGRAAIGSGRGPGLADFRIGQRGGRESVILTAANMPIHNHGATTTVTTVVDSTGSSAVLRALAANASTNVPTDNTLANSPRRENIYSNNAPNVDMALDSIDLTLNLNATSNANTAVNNAGGSQSFSIRDPYLTVTWLIATQGLFPSRN